VNAIQIRPVGSDEWDVVAWLWQCFRHDLAMIVSARPYPDGRYQTRELLEHPSPQRIGYLAWSPHPKTGDVAPVGFALVGGLLADRRSMTALWVAPVLRREVLAGRGGRGLRSQWVA
jgi:hypothetical protein